MPDLQNRAENKEHAGEKLEKEMATHSSIFVWEIPWTEESGGATAHGVRCDLATK